MLKAGRRKQRKATWHRFMHPQRNAGECQEGLKEEKTERLARRNRQ